MWHENSSGEKTFTGGKDAWELATLAAGRCPHFSADTPDEQVADDPVSCYNCRYRRWTADTFICRKTAKKNDFPERR